MTTASTNTTINHSSTATFNTWVNEVYTNLVTNCGLTQTADTGQMAVPCTTAYNGSLNTSAGYYVFAFNDVLQATSPVYIKMEFGTGTGNGNCPNIWLTIGSGTNGAGTITGTVMTRCVAFATNNPPNSPVVNYVSRYCYNATQGFLGMIFKTGAASGPTASQNTGYGGFLIYRSVDNTGAPTATSVHLLTSSNSTALQASGTGFGQILDYSTSSVLALGQASAWGTIPWSETASLRGTSVQVFPIFQQADTTTLAGAGITNACALAMVAELTLGSTLTCTILGATPHTYLSIGCPFGTNVGAPCTMTNVGYSIATVSVIMLWE